ncbi:class D beta-lactamase [Chelatococcus asaccharovorans]|uniref:class D beta-lactamase n=1 Tax=Chelatococcus asaccharovorans TaxID=28210 RepID=UPI000D767E7B|nr:class D beta-lactamase [Chelatococcus asaccharovorans]
MAGFLSLSAGAFSVQAGTLCTVIADAATGKIIRQEGNCDSRVTPASTFKIPLSLMGFDAGFLANEHSPSRPFKKGYAAWIESWKQTTDPTSWMKNSVVWYSRLITEALGEARFRDYVRRFGYGNQDVSGNPGKNDGLTNSWLSSSLKISPLEQIAFLRKLVRQELSVSQQSYAMTGKLTALQDVAGWTIHGKTGAGPVRRADGSPEPGHSYGWFVGWMTKGDRTLLFARLIEDEKREAVSPGIRTRENFLREFPEIVRSSAL